MSQRIAAIVGSTGQQGLSVVKAFAKDGYSVRALTRAPTSEKTLAAFADLKGVTPTHFELEDRTSIEKAFEGADVVYAMTTSGPWILGPPGTPAPTFGEVEQGKLMVDIAKEKGVKIFGWSTVPDALKEYKLENFDCKNVVDEYIKKVDQPAIFFDLASFNENLLRFGGSIKPVEGGGLGYYAPHVNPAAPHSMPSVSLTRDVGTVVSLAFQHFESENLNHQRIGVCERIYSLPEKQAIVEKVLGVKVPLVPLPHVGAPGSVADRMTKAFSEKSYFYPESVPDKFLAKVGFKFQTFEDFVRENVLPMVKEHLPK